jgi:hypothetical protein
MHPQTKGATVIYNSFLRDVFKAHEEKIDNLLGKEKETEKEKEN